MIGFEHKYNNFTPNGMGLGFRSEPLETITDRLMNPCLPHTGSNKHICLPVNFKSAKSLTELAEKYLNAFWQSQFVYEFRGSGYEFRFGDKKIGSYREWAEIGQGNPLDILKVKFPKGDTLLDVISHYGRLESRQDNRLAQQVASVMQSCRNSVSQDDLAALITQAAKEIVAKVESTLQPNV